MARDLLARGAAWLGLSSCLACCATKATDAPHLHQLPTLRPAGLYVPLEPDRPGSLDLVDDGTFSLHLPNGLLDLGEPFVAEGKWRLRVDEWPSYEVLDPVVVLDVARWGAERLDPSEQLPLYSHPDGLALMSPCMTWVFRPRSR